MAILSLGERRIPAHISTAPLNSSPEVIRVAVMLYVRYPFSLRQVEDMLLERGIDLSHETVRFWWNRFGPMFAAEIRKRRTSDRTVARAQWRQLGAA